MKKRVLICFAVFFIVLGVKSAEAAAITWTGAGATTNWNLGTNWMGNVAPGMNDDVTIPTTAKFPNVTVGALCASLTISGATMVTLTSTLGVTNGITVNANVAFVLNAQLTAATMTINNTGTTLTLTGNNKITLSGLCTVTNNATISLGAAATSFTSASLTVNNSAATLTLSGTKVMTVTGDLTVNNNTTLALTGSGSPLLTVNTVTINNSGSTLSLSGVGILKVNLTITNNAAATIAMGNTTVPGITSTGLTLNGNLTFTGTNTLSMTGATGIVVNTTATLATGTSTIVSNALKIANAGTNLTLSGTTLTITGALTTPASCTITLNNPLVVTAVAVTTGVVTFAGTSTLNPSGTCTLTVANGSGIAFTGTCSANFATSTIGTSTVTPATFTAGANNIAFSNVLTNWGTFTCTGTTLSEVAGAGIANKGSMSFLAGTAFTSNKGITNTGNFTLTASSLSIGVPSSTASITNSGKFLWDSSNFTFSSTTGSIVNQAGGIFKITSATSTSTFTFLNTCSIQNSGTMTANAAVFTMSGNSCFINNEVAAASLTTQACTFNVTGVTSTTNITNSGTYIDHASNFAFGTAGSNIQNIGGSMALRGSTVNFNAGGGNAQVLNNTATFTADSLSTISFTTHTSSGITNSAGTFNAGTSNSMCTINLSSTGEVVSNSGTGIFNLGSTSIINSPSATTPVNTISNTSSGAFTLKSDAFGSAAIGQLTVGSTTVSGTFHVERYLSAFRGYRLLSSPVDTAASPGNFTLNYLKGRCFLSGTTGTAGGFDNVVGVNVSNPNMYFFREDVPADPSSFITGNYRGVNDIKTTLPKYGFDNEPTGPFLLPSGNGFLFFSRGDRYAAGQTYATEATASYVPTAATLSATGVINVGPVAVKWWHTGSTTFSATGTNPGLAGFTLVGNPYPSSIDLDTYNTGNPAAGIYAPGTLAAIYMLMPNGNFNVYVPGSGGTSTSGRAGSNIIPSGEGFFVKAITPASSSLTFNEAAKTTAQAVGASFFLGTPVQATPFLSQYLHLTISKDSVNQEGLFINFKSDAQAAYVNGEDAPHRIGSGPANISSVSADNIALSVNTLPLPTTSETIHVNVNSTADGVFKINALTIQSIPELYDIWLMDAYKKDSLDIRHNPVYAFNIIKANTTTYLNRFSLVIRQNPALAVHLLAFTAAKQATGAQVIWKTENEQNYTNFTVERSTDGGTTFATVGGLTSSGLGTYSLLDKAPLTNAADLYRLKLEDLNGAITYSKIVELMYGNLSNSLVKNPVDIYPNPAKTTINLNITPTFNVTTGTIGGNASYGIKIVNNLGSVIKTSTTSQQNWQSDVSTLVPGTYVIQVVNNTDQTIIGKGTFIKL